jgi:hypothetical protein
MPSAKPPRIFLSYPREYEGDLNTVRNLLALAGFDVWKDSEGLLAGESWRDSRRNFYDNRINNQGRASYLAFGGLKPLQGGLLVHDVATQRIWTRDCAYHKGPLVSAAIAARTYREEANKEKLGGFSDWRFPTIEEAMSLMTPQPREGGFHISKLFSDAEFVFTSDGFVASSHLLDPDDRIMSWLRVTDGAVARLRHQGYELVRPSNCLGWCFFRNGARFCIWRRRRR